MAKSLADLRKQYQAMNEGNTTPQKKGGSSDFEKSWLKWNSPDAEGDSVSNLIRFLPGKDDPMDFFVEGQFHRYEIPSEPYARNYKCRRTEGEKCPVCDFYFDLWKRHKALGLPAGEKSAFGNLAAKIKQKPKFFAVAVSRELQAAGEYPVRQVGMSKTLFDRVMKYMLDEEFMDDDNPDGSTIISLERGNDFDLCVTKKGSWNNFDNSAAKYKKTKAGTDAEIAEWMDHDFDLTEHVGIDTYEKGVEIVQALEATLPSVNGEDDPPFETESNIKV